MFTRLAPINTDASNQASAAPSITVKSAPLAAKGRSQAREKETDKIADWLTGVEEEEPGREEGDSHPAAGRPRPVTFSVRPIRDSVGDNGLCLAGLFEKFKSSELA
nr:hypothetical protein BaRGS_025478 [Batillaria attramentaria]